MTRIVKRDDDLTNDDLDVTYLARLSEEYKKSKDVLTDIEKRTNGLKKELSDAVEKFGVADDKGHLWLNLGNSSLKRERRVTRSFDSQSAEVWAKENHHWDDIKDVVEVLSEDKILGLAWSNKELENTIQSFYVEKESVL